MDLALPIVSHPLLAVSLPYLVPLWRVALGAGVALGLMMVVYLLLKLTFPKIAAIAYTTANNGISQPLFWGSLGLGAIILLTHTWIPYYTLGEDLKMYKETGLAWITFFAVVLGVWHASVSIADELEGRTALTLLSKPIGRVHFVVGKLLGVIGPVFVLFVVLGVVFIAAVSYKTVYDARESSLPVPTSAQCLAEIQQILSYLVLAFLKSVVLVSISVAISTRLPMLPNVVICFSIFVLGHLTPLIAQSSVGRLAPVAFVGKLITTISPVLVYYDAPAALVKGQPIPLEYVLSMTGYTALCCLIATLLALIMFVDRDLS